MTKNQQQVIETFCRQYAKYHWLLAGKFLYQCQAPVGQLYRHTLDLTGLPAADIESDELCLAFWGGYMVQVIADRISFADEPHHPLQVGERGCDYGGRPLSE